MRLSLSVTLFCSGLFLPLKERKNEHAIPSWGKDPVEIYRNGNLPIREKGTGQWSISVA